MREVDERALWQVLREAVRLTGRSHRDLEDELRIGHGNIQKLLDGRMRLTVRHLMAFAALLDVPAAELLTVAYPEQATAAQVTAILAAPQNHYFNVHTALNGGGAVRGQLQ